MQISSRPASHLQALDRKLKVPRISPTLGRKKRMRRQGPKFGKVFRLFTIDPNFFLKTRMLPSSHLQALDCKFKVPRILHTLGRRKHMRRQGPKVGKFLGLLESAQTFSADSQQACESFPSGRSQT